MCSSLKQCRLWDKADYFAPGHCHALCGCAGTDRFKGDMDRGDDIIGEIHGHLNQPSAG